MRTRTACVIVALVLCASASAAKEFRGSPTAKELAWIEHNMDLLRTQLKDGESSRFRNTFVSYKLNGKTPVVCGEVNSKNSFGAFGGFQGWIGGGPVGQFLAEQVSDFSDLWNQLCS